MRSSPRDFRLTFWSMILADALRRAGRLEEALDVATQASRRDGRLYGARVVAACALLRLDRIEEARRMLPEARRIQAGAQPRRDQAVFRTQRRSRTGFGLELT